MAAASFQPAFFSEQELFFDWNQKTPTPAATALPAVTVLEETLRDGLQNSSVRLPSLGARLELLHHMAALGVETVNLGMPSSSTQAFEICVRLAQEIGAARLPLRPVCAARMVPADVAAVAQVAEKAGLEIEAYAFLGTSPIRSLVEGWELTTLTAKTNEALTLGRQAGLPLAFVSEDTTRSRPETLTHLFRVAIDQGAQRFCLCDTVGQADPEGVSALLRFVKEWLTQAGAGTDVGLDWHGHNDRGLALANALTAARAGATRVHTTALGLGERVGNVATEQFLTNAALLGWGTSYALQHLPGYCRAVAAHLGVAVSPAQPVVGSDAFRTATGTHAAALRKAGRKGDRWLADRMYSSVVASTLHREQEIALGPFSGSSNAAEVLRRLGFEPSPESVQKLLQVARTADHVLSDEEILARWSPPGRELR